MLRPKTLSTSRGNRLALLCVAGLLAACLPAAGETGSKPMAKSPPPTAATPAPKPASAPTASAPTAKASGRSAAVKPATSPSRPRSATVSGTPRTAPAPRTLDPVHIEGELDVPEVLFITARDQRRIVGFQHGRYLAGSSALARTTPIPSHVVVDRKASPDSVEAAR